MVAIFLGLVLAAHPSTPLGRGRGVVVGMLGCFLLGLACWLVADIAYLLVHLERHAAGDR